METRCPIGLRGPFPARGGLPGLSGRDSDIINAPPQHDLTRQFLCLGRGPGALQSLQYTTIATDKLDEHMQCDCQHAWSGR